MATIFDIAKKAGVSITTVSRALNGYSDVSEKTRQMIVAIAEDLHYYPSAAARSLQGKKTNTIGFAPLLNDHLEAEPFFKELTGVMALSCFRHDLSLLLALVGHYGAVDEVYREAVGSGRVDGLILGDIMPQDERINLLRGLEVPFVAFGRTANPHEMNCPFVDIDGAAGVQAIVKYLYEQGHRCIAYLSEPLGMSFIMYRYKGYQQGLIECGLVQDERLSVTNLSDEKKTLATVTHLLDLPTSIQPTALVTGSDNLALHVLRAVAQAGRTVGRNHQAGQIAVTGFDDLPFASYLQPNLTTLRQPITETCNVLLDLLVALLKNRNGEATLQGHPDITKVGLNQFLLQPQLIVRNSA